MGALRHADEQEPAPVSVSNRRGAGRFVVVCDHASNHVPARFGSLGLAAAELKRHIAWDPGALPVAQALAKLLDAPLVASGVSRLVIDCNRPLDAPDLIAPRSEATDIPGNAGLDAAARAERVALSHAPFHDAVEALVGERLVAGLGCEMIAVHSFTPVYKGVARPWHVGVIHDADERLSRPLLAALSRVPDVAVGDNEPYSPADRVYYTLERHARARGLPCVMIEIRNDEIATASAQRMWAERLAPCLRGVEAAPGVRGVGG